MSSILHANESEVSYNCRAKYAISKSGEATLLSIESASQPIFRPSGWERSEHDEPGERLVENSVESDPERNRARALGRAKVRAFDFIMCNPDLDAFATFTYDPEKADRSSYDDCYNIIKIWLSNRVQRRGLKYVIAPELHKDGEAVHFHALMNSDALKYSRAISPYTGRGLLRNGRAIWNISDWTAGFSTMQIVPESDPREKVAKYIFKYMGKQSGALIGGRYFLAGGDLAEPVYRYANYVEAFYPPAAKYTRGFDILPDLHYSKSTYL